MDYAGSIARLCPASFVGNDNSEGKEMGEHKQKRPRPTDYKLNTKSVCPSCGQILDGALNPEIMQAPKPGNISICMDCSHISIFGDDMSLRPLNDQEMHDIAGDPKMLLYIDILDFFNKHVRTKK